MKSQEYVVGSSSSDTDTEKVSPYRVKASSDKNSRPSTLDSSSGTETLSINDSSSQESSSSESKGSYEKKRKADLARTTAENRKKKTKTRDASKVPSSNMKGLKSIPGYSAVALDASDFVSDASDMFSDLNGKQVWHITAPASVPITAIEWLDIPAALRGEPILHHKGASYNMSVSTAKDEALLLPRSSTGAYSKVETGISRSFDLREMASKQATEVDARESSSLGDEASTNGTAGHSSMEFVAKEKGSKRPARQQPSGLLMRYQPYGSTISSSKAYRLSQPDEDENEEVYVASRNGFEVPHLDDDEALQNKGVDYEKDKHKKSSRHRGSSSSPELVLPGDAMNVDDTQNGSVPGTPREKLKRSREKSRLEKKKKHKEKL